jgi:plastocyanin
LVVLLLALQLPPEAGAGASDAIVDLPLIVKSIPTVEGDIALHTVDIVDFAYQPAYGVQADGVTITWSNTGHETHTVTFDGGEGDSSPLPPGATFGFVLPHTGRLTYYCAIHPSMTGTIDVLPRKEPPSAPTRTPTPERAITQTPSVSTT